MNALSSVDSCKHEKSVFDDPQEHQFVHVNDERGSVFRERAVCLLSEYIANAASGKMRYKSS